MHCVLLEACRVGPAGSEGEVSTPVDWLGVHCVFRLLVPCDGLCSRMHKICGQHKTYLDIIVPVLK